MLLKPGNRIGAIDPAAKIEQSVGRLTSTLGLQQRSLAIMEDELGKVTEKYKEGSIQARRKELALDSLRGSIAATEQKLGELGQSIERTAIAQEQKAVAAAEAHARKLAAVSEQLVFQKRQLDIQEQKLGEVVKAHGAASEQAQQQALALDRLKGSIAANEKALMGLGGALDKVDAEASQFRQKLESLAAPVDRNAQAFNALGEVVTGAFRRAGEMGIEALAQGLQGMVDQVVAAGAAGMEFNSTMEQVEGKLGALTGSSTATAEALALIRQEASEVPFIPLQDLARAATDLQPATKIAKTGLDDLLNTAELLAASNMEEGINGASFALREAVSGDFTSLIERFNLPRTMINKLKEEGVPALEIVKRSLAELGITTDLLAAQSNTASARWAGLKGVMDATAGTATKDAYDAISESLGGMLDKMQENGPTIQRWAEGVGEHLGNAAEAGVRLVEGVNWVALGNLIDEAASKAERLAGFLSQVGEGIGAEMNDATQRRILVDAINDTAAALEEQGRSAEAGRLTYTAYRGSIEDAIGLLEAMPGATDLFSESVRRHSIEWGMMADPIAEAANAMQGMIDRGRDWTSVQEEMAAAQASNVQAMKDSIGSGFVNDFEIDNAPSEALQESFDKLAEDRMEHRTKLLDQEAKSFESLASKQIDINNKMADEERKYTKSVADVHADLAKARADIQGKIADKYKETLNKFGELERDHQKELNSIQAEGAKAAQEAEQGRLAAGDKRRAAEKQAEAEHGLALIELDRKHAADQEKNALDLSRKREDIERARVQNQEEITRTLGELERKRTEAILDAQAKATAAEVDLAKDLVSIEDKKIKDLEKLQEAHEKRARKTREGMAELEDKISGNAMKLVANGRRTLESFLKGEDRKRYNELKKQLIDEKNEHEKAVQDREKLAHDDTEAAHDANQTKLDALNSRLAEEKAALDRQQEEAIRRHTQEEENRKITNERALADLQTRIAAEEAEFTRQQAALDAKRDEALGKAKAGHEAELAAIREKNAAAGVALEERLKAEQDRYAEQGAALREQYTTETADLRASYEERAKATREKLGEMRQAHLESEYDLRYQMYETSVEHQKRMAEIAAQWDGPLTKVQEYEAAWRRAAEMGAAATGATPATNATYGGERAGGGDINAGATYLVGEAGRELVTSRQNAAVLNNRATEALLGQSSGAMGGGGAGMGGGLVVQGDLVNMSGLTVTNEADEQRLVDRAVREMDARLIQVLKGGRTQQQVAGARHTIGRRLPGGS
jgi:hypothetical protein